MEMCRMCLVAREGMLPMDEKFLIKYNIFTNLNITTEDKSLYACSTCFHAAIYCFEFREKCIKSDQAFKDLIIDIPKLENDNLNTGEINETLTEVKQETLEIVGDVDDAEFIDDCYNYGEDYVEPVVKRSSKREVKKEPVVDKLPKLKCGICPTVLESDAELSDHLDHHKPDYACAICKESLISAPNMLGHRIKHLPKTERRCHICSRKFISSENLEFHYMRVHEMAEKDAMILCQKCLKPFPTVKKLQKHLAHHAEMKYTCDHCSKKCQSMVEKKPDDSHEERNRTRRINDPYDDEKLEEERNQRNREKCKRYREKKKNAIASGTISRPLDSNDTERDEERKQKNREKARRYREKKKNQVAAVSNSSLLDSEEKEREEERKRQSRERSRRYRENKKKKIEVEVAPLSMTTADSSSDSSSDIKMEHNETK